MTKEIPNTLHPLESDRIRLRALEPEDIDFIYQWENNPEIWRVSNTLIPFSRFVLQQFLENAHRDLFEVKQLRLMIEKKEEGVFLPIGTIELFDFDPHHQRAGIGILIAEEKNRQKGYATETLQLFLKYAFNHLGIHQIYCNIELNNEASIHLFKKCGFEVIGIKKDWLKIPGGGWADELFLQCIRQYPA